MDKALSMMVGIIVFAAVAIILIMLMNSTLPNIADSFKSSICKFSAYMRSTTIGLPAVQQAIATTTALTSSSMTSALNVGLACTPFASINPVNSLDAVIAKIADSSVKCWDNFGNGVWDPLVLMSSQTFVCYKQTINITCSVDDINALSAVNDDNLFDQDDLNNYLSTHYYSFAGVKKTYSNFIPKGLPIIGTDFASTFVCDGESHKYLVSLYFVDSFKYLRNTFPSVSCASLSSDDLLSDKLYLCIMEVN